MSHARSSLRSTRLQVFYLLLLIIFGAPAFVIAKWLSLADESSFQHQNLVRRC
jgi:hypothetical protein